MALRLCGPITNQELANWEIRPAETLHTELSERTLEHQNACCAESGQYPLIIGTQKQPIKFQERNLATHYKIL